MFLGREEELRALTEELSNWKHRSAVLVYGKRRVGKSTLINEAANSFGGVVIDHFCVNSTLDGNLELIFQSVSEALGLPRLRFDSLSAMMEYLGTLKQRLLLILDEYPYLRQTRKPGEIDSLMQHVIDRLPDNVKLVLCGSYIAVMKELLAESNPLFGRFSLIQHLREFDYYDAALFYPGLSTRERIAFYAVFGGSPYVLEQVDVDLPLSENITRLVLPETGLIRSHIENIMLREIQRSYDTRILEAIGNGRKRYGEIRDWLRFPETGLLDKQLKVLLEMETIGKTEPINRRNDKKKQFYEIVDNLMRFYFTFVFGRAGTIARIGAEQFYRRNVEDAIGQFISRRLEGLTLQYFHRMTVSGQYPDIEDFGSYWYDDPIARENGEFDCVLKRSGERYDFYECKNYAGKMTQAECEEEERQIRNVRGMTVSGIGFVCTGGFSFDGKGRYTLVDGDALYDEALRVR